MNSAFPSRKMRDCELARTFCFWKPYKHTRKMAKVLSFQTIPCLYWKNDKGVKPANGFQPAFSGHSVNSFAYDYSQVIYSSTPVQFRLIALPEQNLPRICEFLKTALPEQTTPASRADKDTRGLRNAYRVIRGTTVLPSTLQQYKGYTIYSAYHNVTVEEGWAVHVDDVQKTGILSAEFLDVKLLAPWRSPTTDRPQLPITSSHHRPSLQLL